MLPACQSANMAGRPACQSTNVAGRYLYLSVDRQLSYGARSYKSQIKFKTEYRIKNILECKAHTSLY